MPRSAVSDAVRGIKTISARFGLPIVIFGHAGDGNLHPNILFGRRDPDQWEQVGRAVADEFDLALRLGGTLSGEHSVGALKRPYSCRLLAEYRSTFSRKSKPLSIP